MNTYIFSFVLLVKLPKKILLYRHILKFNFVNFKYGFCDFCCISVSFFNSFLLDKLCMFLYFHLGKKIFFKIVLIVLLSSNDNNSLIIAKSYRNFFGYAISFTIYILYLLDILLHTVCVAPLYLPV